MANGPLGGFMPTPPSPGQPPQVKLETSAESRGAFNKFLGTLPSNGAVAPIQTGVDVSSTTPVSPVTSNVNIFQPQMSQMAPMPMMPPAQPVQMMFNGGEAEDFSDFGGFSDPSDPFGGGDSFNDSSDTSDPFIGESVSLSPAEIAGGTLSTPDTSLFSDDPATGANIGLEKSGGFTTGVAPGSGLSGGNRFATFFNLPFALRGVGRDFQTKLNRDPNLTVGEYFDTYNPGGNADRLLEFAQNTGKLRDDKLDIGDMPNIMKTQAKFEIGSPESRNIPTELLNRAVQSVNVNDPKEVSNILFDFDPNPLALTLDDLNVDSNLQAFNRLGPGNRLPANISFNDLTAATTPGTPQYEATRGGNLSSIEAGGSPFAPNTLFNFDRRPVDFEEPVGTPGALRLDGRQFAPGRQVRYSPFGTTFPTERADQQELRQIDDDEFNPKVIEAYERGSTLGKALANDFLNANRMPGTAVSDFLNLATRTQNVSPGNTAARIARNNRTINEIRADLGSRVPDTALETLEGRRDRLPDQVFDIETITPEDDRLTTVSPDVLASIGREQRIDDANTFRQTVPDAAKIFGGREVTTTPRGIDQELSPIVAAGIGAPKEFIQPFPDAGINAFGFTIPTLTSGLNALSNFSRQRVFDAVLNKGATPVYDGNTLVGAKINGVLVEGMDPNAPMDSGDNQDPITKFLRKATEDKKEEDKDDQPPNQIGDVVIRDPEPPKPTVVKSTAPASTASFTPVGFNVSNLNDLIARITGVPTPRRMQEGGTVAAVDKFLSKVA